MIILRIALPVLAFMLAAVPAVHAQTKLALLIGNKNYLPTVGPLKNPHNDVQLIEVELKKIGFKTTIIKDASFSEMNRQMNAYVRSVRDAGPDAISFIYYSGHGAKNEANGSDYLIPVDVPTAQDDTIWDGSIRLSDVTNMLRNDAANAVHFVVVDACRNTLRLSRPGTKAPVSAKGFSPVRELRGILVAYATAEGETASDTGETAGPYARALVQEIGRPGIEAVSMFRRVQIRVQSEIGQTPYLGFDALREVFLAGLSTDQIGQAAVAPSPQRPAVAAKFGGKPDTLCADLRLLAELAKEDFNAIAGSKTWDNVVAAQATLAGFRKCEIRKINASTMYSCGAAPQRDDAKANRELKNIASTIEKCLAPEWKRSTFDVGGMTSFFGANRVVVSASLMPQFELSGTSTKVPQLTVYQMPNQDKPAKAPVAPPSKPDGYCTELKTIVEGASKNFDPFINASRKPPWVSRIQLKGFETCTISELSESAANKRRLRYHSCGLGPFPDKAQADDMATEILADVQSCLGSSWSVKKSRRTMDDGIDFDLVSADTAHTVEVMSRHNLDKLWEVHLDVNMRD